jgi:hypothetical protein
MPQLEVRIYCGINGADPVSFTKTVNVTHEELEDLVPEKPSDGSAGWGYWNEALELICSVVKERFFPDERTPLYREDDLRRLGVTSLSAAFDHDERGTMSMTVIHGE